MTMKPFRVLLCGSMMLLAVAMSTGCGWLGITQPPVLGPVTTSAIPEIGHNELSNKWQHWQLAPAKPAACATAAAGPIVVGDFDNDGSLDQMVMLDVMGTPHWAVILTRIDEPAVYELELPKGAVPAAVAVHKRGTRYRVPGMSVDDYYSADTLGTDACGPAGVIWRWTGDGFTLATLTVAK